jgi:hypothetical protein
MTKVQKDSHEKIHSEEKDLVNTQQRQTLWKMRFIRCLKLIGLFIVCFGLYMLWFIRAKPAVDTDYVSQLNQISRPENYKKEENAWPHYKKAIELFAEPIAGDEHRLILGFPQREFPELKEAEQKSVIEWIEQNQAVWQEFIEAGLKPYCYIEYTLQEMDEDFYHKLNIPTMKIDLSHLDGLRRLTMLGKWRIKVEIETGNIEHALDDCYTLINTGTQWIQNKCFVEAMVGYALRNTGYEGLSKIIYRKEFPERQLKDIQDRLANMYGTTDTTFDFEFEKILFLDIVQHTFTKGGFGGGHLIPKYLSPLVQFGSVVITLGELETEPTTREKVLYVIMSLLHARRNKTILRYEEMIDHAKKIQKMTPYEIKKSGDLIDIKYPHISNYNIHFDSFLRESRYFLVGLSMPAIESISTVKYKNQATYEATITILALKRYMVKNNAYPESLEELWSNGYIKKLPIDPYSDKPMVYKQTATNFMLYSVGENFVDDGGEPVFYGGSNTVQKWGNVTDEGGDAVFWPSR